MKLLNIDYNLKTMNITEFLNDQYNDAALYILYRNTASYVDGLKNGARKTIYTIKKTNLKTPLKVTALGSKVVDVAAYLHGESGIQGSIVTQAANYCGANNLPTLLGVGAFGTRFLNVASAPRYIFAGAPDYFEQLFRNADDVNLVTQEFEGKEIEPIFYVPTLPLILLNGSEGVGVGFASTIYPRPIENVIKLTRAAIEKKNIKAEWLRPGWKGFKGTVEKTDDGSWLVKGLARFEGKKVYIDELPVSWELKKYTNKLDKLKEMKLISKYHDFSEDDNYRFEVWLTDAELSKDPDRIWKDLGLVDRISENLITMDENNAVREYTNIRDLFNDYYKIKIKYLKLRIKSEIARLTKEESDLKEIYEFVQEVIKGTIVLKNKKKADVEAELKKKGYTIIERLLGMPLYSITSDKAKEIEKKWKDKVKEREAMEKETPESQWSKDIDELEEELKKEGILGNGSKKTNDSKRSDH